MSSTGTYPIIISLDLGMLFNVLVGIAGVCISVVAYRLYFNASSLNDERLAQWLHIECHSDRLIEDDEFPDLAVVDRFTGTRIARMAVAHARTELGLLTPSGANRKVVSDVVRKYMKNRNMRPSHISKYFMTAVELYFFASEDDKSLERVRKTKYASEWLRGKEASA